jgi:hypothetical protein
VNTVPTPAKPTTVVAMASRICLLDNSLSSAAKVDPPAGRFGMTAASSMPPASATPASAKNGARQPNC